MWQKEFKPLELRGGNRLTVDLLQRDFDVVRILDHVDRTLDKVVLLDRYIERTVIEAMQGLVAKEVCMLQLDSQVVDMAVSARGKVGNRKRRLGAG